MPLSSSTPESLVIIAGRGVYPLELARAARAQGVRRILALAFRGETDRALARLADETRRLYVGRLAEMLGQLRDWGVADAVMAGQIRPRHLFYLRPDRALRDLLARLPARNAETIFGAVGDEMRKIGVTLQPAHRFMEANLPAPGLLAARAPTESERRDIELGFRVARELAQLDIGQTVAVKNGTVLAVEAFEGTNPMLRRAGKLGGPGAVIVKRAKPGQDMRFDIPVIGRQTLEWLRKIRAAALAVEAGGTLLLERDALRAAADRQNLCFLAVPAPADIPPSAD